jgi:excisionase family DNA binding protein
MAEARMNLMTAKEAAEYLRVSMFTLSKIEREGGLVPYRTPGGHRRYSLRMLNQYLRGSRRQEGEEGRVSTLPHSMEASKVQREEVEQVTH